MKRFYWFSLIPMMVLVILMMPRNANWREEITAQNKDYEVRLSKTWYSEFQSEKTAKHEESAALQTSEQAVEMREVTDYEYELLCRVCMSEAGGKYGEPFIGKVAVVETILNRVDMGRGTIEEVVFEPNQYSTADNGEPDETVIEAVDHALKEDLFPDNMIYFRVGRYHGFGKPYEKIGNHYFSLEEE